MSLSIRGKAKCTRSRAKTTRKTLETKMITWWSTSSILGLDENDRPKITISTRIIDKPSSPSQRLSRQRHSMWDGRWKDGVYSQMEDMTTSSTTLRHWRSSIRRTRIGKTTLRRRSLEISLLSSHLMMKRSVTCWSRKAGQSGIRRTSSTLSKWLSCTAAPLSPLTAIGMDCHKSLLIKSKLMLRHFGRITKKLKIIKSTLKESLRVS